MSAASPTPKTRKLPSEKSGVSRAIRSAGTAEKLKSSAQKSKPRESAHAKTSPEGVRKEKVTKAKALIRDPHYPTRQVLESVARRLAQKWHHDDR